MVNKCSVPGCFSNHAGHEKETVFALPEDGQQRNLWLRFITRSDVEEFKHIFVCAKHFSEDVIKKNEKRCRLIKQLNPVPTIVPPRQNISNVSEAVLRTIKPTRKPPKARIYQEDQLPDFKKQDSIASLDSITIKQIKCLGDGFILEKKKDYALIYQIERPSRDIPIVTHCIRVNKNLTVEIRYKGIPMPLPPWFRAGRNTVLISFSIITNLVNYMKNRAVEHQEIFTELEDLKYQRQPSYSSNLIRFSLQLRYTSIQAYELLRKEFSLPSVSFLKTFTSGE